MKVLILLILVFILGCGPAADDIPLYDIEQHKKYQDEKGREKVKKEYLKLADDNSSSPEALYLLARCFGLDNAEAVKLIDRSLEIKPDFAEALHAKGIILLNDKFENLNKCFQAKNAYEKCIELGKDDAYSRGGLVYALECIAFNEKDLKLKVQWYKRALEEAIIASSSKGSQSIMEENGSDYFVSLNNFYKTKINELELEIEKKYKCQLFAGFYEGELQLGNSYGRAAINIFEDCTCAYKSKLVLITGRVESMEEYGTLKDFSTFNSSSVYGNFEAVTADGSMPYTYRFSWNNGGVVQISHDANPGWNNSYLAVMYKG